MLVLRFDRVRAGEGWSRLPVEDAAQVMGLPPAAKYNVASEDAAVALARACKAPMVALRSLYLQFVFAWLTGNGDLHAKNISVLGDRCGDFAAAPVYDVPCTLVYDDDSQALPMDGRTRNLGARHWAAFAEAIGLPQRAAESANGLALKASSSADLSSLPFEGSPLRGAQRELRHRRSELMG